MKKSLLFACIMAFVIILSTACGGTKPTYAVDFEADNLLTWQTVCFNEDMTADNLTIDTADGFKGKALNAKISQIEDGNTWWVTGIAMSPELTTEENFKDLKRISFNYKSTVAYQEVPFIVQLVWKDKDTGDELGSIQIDFPMEKTNKVKTFEIEVPEDLTTELNSASNMYLDWFMVGLEDNAGDAFRPGKFTIDNIAFYNK